MLYKSSSFSFFLHVTLVFLKFPIHTTPMIIQRDCCLFISNSRNLIVLFLSLSSWISSPLYHTRFSSIHEEITWSSFSNLFSLLSSINVYFHSAPWPILSQNIFMQTLLRFSSILSYFSSFQKPNHRHKYSNPAIFSIIYLTDMNMAIFCFSVPCFV